MASNDPHLPVVGVISASLGTIHGSENVPTDAMLSGALAHNTGNLAFRYAVWHHILSPKIHFTWDADPREVRERCQVLVIPSSNQANPASDYGKRATFLEEVDLPVVPVGLGAQASVIGERLRLTAGTIRYLRSLGDRSTAIGIRGGYTGEVLSDLGIDNVVEVGCPANLINPDPHLGQQIERRLRSPEGRAIAVATSDLTPGHQTFEAKLFQWLLERDGLYVCQSHSYLVALARRMSGDLSELEKEQVRDYLLPGSSESRFLGAAARHFRVFFSVAEWMDAIRGVELSIGARIHGNLLAIQAGVPGICVYHDSRTEELARTLRIPLISHVELEAAGSLEQVCEELEFDGTAYDRRRAELACRYQQLMARSGIRVRGELARPEEAVP